jgi:hypothetical protein
MKPPPPRVLRKGALVRVAGIQGDVDASAAAFAFLDLRFPDGHVERWLGPASIGRVDATPIGLENLQSWAAQAANEFAFDIACDIARHYATPRPPAVDDLPCEEVVIEWRSELPAVELPSGG